MTSGTIAVVNSSPTICDLNTCFELDDADAHKRVLVSTPGLKLIYLSMAPGQGMPLHNHPGCTVAIQGMIGDATVLLDGESHPLRPQELISFSGELMVSPRNESNAPAGVLITLSSGA